MFVCLFVFIVMPFIVVTGVCKINGAATVVDCCYSIGFSTSDRQQQKHRFFANTGIAVIVIVVIGVVILVSVGVIVVTVV